VAAPATHQAAQAQAAKSTTHTAPVAKAAPATPVKAAELLNINTATKEQLAALPGIGDAYSQKIIDGRPYKAKSDLKARKIIPASEYSKISTLIVAKKPAK
jgi:DNA uptake protein ComE-like DNA-binding protein